jgi:hypothetical protein
MKAGRLAVAWALTMVTASVALAQYSEAWQVPDSSSSSSKFVGCEDTDGDNSKEVVIVLGHTWIKVIDATTGVVEWYLSPMWYNISDAWLLDVDDDGRFEILVDGTETFGWPQWSLFRYSGGTALNGQPPSQSSYQEVVLGQNHPNPSPGLTKMDYSLGSGGDVAIKVYDSVGKLVRELVEGLKAPGKHTTVWDARDNKGAVLPNGTYFYQIEVNGARKGERKLLLLKQQ